MPARPSYPPKIRRPVTDEPLVVPGLGCPVPIGASGALLQLGRDRLKCRDEGVYEALVVDVGADALDPPRGGLTDRPLDRLKERRIGLRIMERLAGRVEQGHAALRQEEPHR